MFRERRSPILCDASVPCFRDNANHVTTKVLWDLRVICLNSVECGTELSILRTLGSSEKSFRLAVIVSTLSDI